MLPWLDSATKMLGGKYFPITPPSLPYKNGGDDDTFNKIAQKKRVSGTFTGKQVHGLDQLWRQQHHP